MFKQLPNCAAKKSKFAALAGVALLIAPFAASQGQSAPLAGASRQLDANHVKGDFIQVGGLKQRDYRAADRHGYHHFQFRYSGDFPHYRYLTFDEAYEDDGYYPPQPHYFSHRYNWYPPAATFRYADGPWYAW
jgi:hypothetical protein